MTHTAQILKAGAGSGKTFRLAYEYILDVLRDRDNVPGRFDPTAYRSILAVTFTNKATEEMKSRILKQIHLLASGQKSQYLDKLKAATGLSERTLRERAMNVRTAILHDYSRFTVLTNDTFFQRILRAFIKELGIERNYAIELDTAPVITKSTDALINDITTNEELNSWLSDMARDRINKGERWNIREGINLLSRELFKEETHEPIEQIKDKELFRQRIESYTKAVEQMEKEVSEYASTAVEDIRSAGYKHDDFTRGFTAFFEEVSTEGCKAPTKTILAHCSDEPEQWLRKADRKDATLVALATRLQPKLATLCDRLATLATAVSTRSLLQRNYHSYALLNDLYKKAKTICSAENSILLSETKHIIAKLICEEDAPFIYEKVGGRFEKFMIDEFQDTSLKEWYNFLPLLRNAMAQSEHIAVLLVGDIKQSIYRWRGGDWRILGRMATEGLGSDMVLPDSLDCNYRSLPQVVRFNNSIFEHVVKLDNANLNHALNEALQNKKISPKLHSELLDTLDKAYDGHAQTPMRDCKHQGYIDVTIYPDQATDENGKKLKMEPNIIGRIKQILDWGYKPCDITVLVRNNREATTIAERLLAARAALEPQHYFDITTQEALSVNNSHAVHFIIAVMRLAINRKERIAAAIYNLYQNNGHFTATLSEEETHFLDTLRMLSPEEAFEYIAIRYADILRGQEAYIEALHEQIVRFCAGRVADLALWLNWWEENGEKQSVTVERSERSLEIMTIHKFKGLENKIIIIPYCNWRLDPLTSSGRITNNVWAKPSPSGALNEMGLYPVAYGNAMADSEFAEGYYTEKIYSHVDNTNILYVALTRAGEQLHIFIPEHRTEASAGGVVHAALDSLTAAEEPKIIITRSEDAEDGTTHYRSGIQQGPEPEEEERKNESAQIRLTAYTPSPVSLALRTSYNRYVEPDSKLSPREMGVMMHRAFEGATSRDEIKRAIEQMVTDGVLSEVEAKRLRNHIDTTLDTTIAGEWFDNSWHEVHCEQGVIIPEKSDKQSTKQLLVRPDRVMSNGERCVIVDYKFGSEQSSHLRQVGRYAELLRRMGYKQVEGYVWYVTSGRIVKCE